YLMMSFIAPTTTQLYPLSLHDALPISTLSQEILESELFGHERGAFTSAHQLKTGLIEAAHGGTLFLDEVNEMGAGCQAKILRVLDRKSTRLNSSHLVISYAVFCLKKKK